jgi:HK97 family phage portal protein
MPFLDRLAGIFAPTVTKADPPADPVTLTDPLASFLFGALPTLSNVSVTPKSAMTVPAVASAVELIAEAVGTLPVKLFVRNAEGKEADSAHPAFRLAHDEANDWTSAAELRTQLTRDALLYDVGGFALANRVGERVIEFIRLDPTAVTVKTDEATGEPFYVVREGKRNVRHHYRDILHIRAFDDAAPITRARNAIGLAMSLEQHAAKLFANSARPSGILKTGQKNATALDNIKASWNAAFGSGNSGGTAVMPDDTEYQALTMSSVDAQFAEMRRFQTEEIARAFRVPPTMLFDLERGTWSNTEEMGRQFLTYTLRPWLDAWEWAYARVLLTAEERAERYFEFVTDDLLTVSFAQRAASYGQYRSMGAMTANEVRAGLNLPPLPGGDVLSNPYTTTTSAPPAADNDNTPTIEEDAA